MKITKMEVITEVVISNPYALEKVRFVSHSPSEYLAVVDEVNVLFGKEHGGIADPTSHRLEPRSSKESEEMPGFEGTREALDKLTVIKPFE